MGRGATRRPSSGGQRGTRWATNMGDINIGPAGAGGHPPVMRAGWSPGLARSRVAGDHTTPMTSRTTNGSSSTRSAPPARTWTPPPATSPSSRKSSPIGVASNAVEADELPHQHRFVRGLRRDYAAVLNGLTLPHSSGEVEGNVNRIKMIKRQMYGPAGFDLLRKRILLAG